MVQSVPALMQVVKGSRAREAEPQGADSSFKKIFNPLATSMAFFYN